MPKKYLIISSFTLLVIIGLGGWWYYTRVYTKPISTEQNETADWKTYRNVEDGFEFKYPSEWQIQGFVGGEKGQGDIYAYITDSNGNIQYSIDIYSKNKFIDPPGAKVLDIDINGTPAELFSWEVRTSEGFSKSSAIEIGYNIGSIVVFHSSSSFYDLSGTLRSKGSDRELFDPESTIRKSIATFRFPFWGLDNKIN